jgi:NAD(P)-dependent dehydrogenase (short-subunit alcohol dehydrogenase family)
MADDRQWREMTADPKFRRVLVTNGRSVIGQEAAAALKAAGARTVFVGVAEPWRPFAGENLLRGQEGIEVVTLDAADEKSATDLAADIGGKVDILVNTTEHVRPGGLLDRRGTSIARDEIDQAYLGFINLAQAFGPAMRMRGADGSAAWVNVLSVYALANLPAFGAYSASQAACLSLSHCLRAELRPGGVKVMNLFTGPVDIEWFQTVPPPKVAPRAVAQAIVSGLRGGLEEMYVGDVAEEIRQRLAANPKALERELDR